jgi:hypothetical protein
MLNWLGRRLAIVVMLLLWVDPVRAQACCAAVSAVTPGRLALHERGLIGLAPSASWVLGSFDASGQFVGKEAGAQQTDLQLLPFGTIRLIHRGQLGVSLPLLASLRRTKHVPSEFGGGIGDLAMTGRYDFIRDGQYRVLPGVALLLGVTAPTGRPPESSITELGSDVTGLGVWQFSGGGWLEHSLGDWSVSLAGLVAGRTARQSGGIQTHLAPRFTGLVAAGYSFSQKLGLAASVSYSVEGKAHVDGEQVPDTERRQLRTSLAMSLNLVEHWRGQASVYVDPPIDSLSQNQLSLVGSSLTLIRNW